MPAMYAHQRFGEVVLDELPQSIRERIASCRDLFDIGLQGPDIFFYHDPIFWGTYPQYGNRLHGMSGHAFFRMALEEYGKRYGKSRTDAVPETDTEAPYRTESGMRDVSDTGACAGPEDRTDSTRPAGERSDAWGKGMAPEGSGSLGEKGSVFAMATRIYLYGVICHYALDSRCHPYINEAAAAGAATHAEIEGDFDRHVLESEGKNPVMENVSRGIHPSNRAAQAIEVIYPEADRKIVLSSLRRCVLFQSLLLCRHDTKRNLICGALRLIGKYQSLKPHIMSPDPDPDCAGTVRHLDELFREAIPLAVRRIVQMDEEMEKGLFPDVSSCDYDRDFDGKEAGA